MDADLPVLTQSRPLGARGSRSIVGSADPTAELTPTAAAVVAAIPAWWSARAAAAGLDGQWLDVHEAIEGLDPPVSLAECPPLQPEWGRVDGCQSSRGIRLGRAVLLALHRIRHREE